MVLADEKLCRDLAVAEVREPKLSLTQQFLEVHRVAEGESGPLTAGVVAVDNRVDVYFRLVNEKYFLVLCVTFNDTGPSVSFCRAEARCRVYLSITSDTIAPEEVTSTLHLSPTESWRRGDPSRHPGGIPRKFHAWYFDPLGEDPGECDQKMKALLILLADASSEIRKLRMRCAASLCVVYHGYQDQMWGLHWSAHTIQQIAALGVDVDVDLYASGPDLES